MKTAFLMLATALALNACSAPAPTPAEAAMAAARAAISVQLRDPQSAQFSLETYTSDGVVCGFVNAKNAFGGYVGPKSYLYSKGELRMADVDPEAYHAEWFKACVRAPA